MIDGITGGPMFSFVMADQKTLEKLRNMYDRISPDEFKARMLTIRSNFATSIFHTSHPSSPKERERYFLNTLKVNFEALELPVAEIGARGAAINKMVDSLFIFQPVGPDGQIFPPFFHMNHFKFLDSADLISYALTLPPAEIMSRAHMLKQNEDLLLIKVRDLRPKMIQSFFKVEPNEIEKRVTIMRALAEYQINVFKTEGSEIERIGIRAGLIDRANLTRDLSEFERMNASLMERLQTDTLTRAASEIKIDDLEENARFIMGPLDAFLKFTKLYELLKLLFESHRVNFITDCLNKLEPAENYSRLAAIEQNWGAISQVAPRPWQQLDVVKAALGLPSDESHNRLAALIKYQDLLPLKLNKGTVLATKSAEEIFALTKKQ